VSPVCGQNSSIREATRKSHRNVLKKSGLMKVVEITVDGHILLYYNPK